MMENFELEAYHVPPELRDQVKISRTMVYEDESTRILLKIPSIDRTLIQSLPHHLKKKRSYLAHLPIEKIVHVLDEASRRWLDKNYPLRKLALKTIPLITGFSPEVVEASIDVEMESSLREDMWRTLSLEIGNPLYLDDFQYSPQLGGYSRAFGPELIVSIFSENIPALPHLLFMRSALVKSACLGKVARGEPTFAPLYLKTIEEIDPEMAKCMAVLYWQGGEEEIEASLFEQASAVVLFGGVEACRSLMEKIPRRIRTLVHGHRLGFGVIGRQRMNRQGLERLAEAVALDCSMFDQQACLAPHVYYLEEGGEVSPKEFCQAVAVAMKALNERMPRGRISPGEASAIHQLRAAYEFRELNGEDVLVLASSPKTDWTVVYEKDPGIFSPSPLNRFIRIFGVEDIFQVPPALKPIGPFLQNAAVAIGDDREKEFIRILGGLGVARITSPGKMSVPSMMWHHDGISPLASLLRWCDMEKKDEF
ncbi:MAG: acyl-CoA reductase [Thermodesulfobacteriota bacterium]|nr:acyl-CoA reductase [Thermodesulfobacteriota bacterium]